MQQQKFYLAQQQKIKSLQQCFVFLLTLKLRIPKLSMGLQLISSVVNSLHHAWIIQTQMLRLKNSRIFSKQHFNRYQHHRHHRRYHHRHHCRRHRHHRRHHHHHLRHHLRWLKCIFDYGHRQRKQHLLFLSYLRLRHQEMIGIEAFSEILAHQRLS